MALIGAPESRGQQAVLRKLKAMAERCMTMPPAEQHRCFDEMVAAGMAQCDQSPPSEAEQCFAVMKEIAMVAENVGAPLAAVGDVSATTTSSASLGGRVDVAESRPAFEPAPQTQARPARAPGPNDQRVKILLTEAEMQAVEIHKVAVPELRGSGVANNVVEVLNVTAVDAASISPELKVIGSNDINAMLGMEKKKELLGCDDMSCMAEIAGALGVDAILTVSAGKVGSTYRISATLVESAKARAIVRGSVKSKDIDELIDLVEGLIPAVVRPVIK